MFPLLFKSVGIDSLPDAVLKTHKHHRVSFPLNNTRSSTLFALAHLDI